MTWESSNPFPSWLVGSYIKNGPSQRQFGSEKRWYSHYFDSWAKLNKIQFTKEGQVLYSGRMIESSNYKRCAEAERMVPSMTVGPVSPHDWTRMEMIEGAVHS